jgi:hypothetical protein
MQELLDRIQAAAGISGEQAQKALDTVKEFVKEKFPMLEGAVENIFNEGMSKGEDLFGGLKEKVGGFFS